MKTIFSNIAYVLLLLSSLLWVSCDDWLEEEPQNKLKPSTVTDYDELLNNGYPNATDYFDEVPLDYYVEILADDADLSYYNPDQLVYPFVPFSFADTHEDASMRGGYDQAWKHFYQSIYYANAVLTNIDEADGPTLEKMSVKGEAMVLRAFAYFKLINLYAKPYDPATAAYDPGVPLKLDPTVQSESYTRQSVQKIYDQIDLDLQEGIRLMSEFPRTISSKYKFSPIAARLLASRVALYKKEYQKVVDYASAVIAERPGVLNLSTNRYATAQTWGYGTGIRTHAFADNSTNVLFKYGTNEFYYYIYTPGALGLSADLIGCFEPGDIRLYYSSYSQGTSRKYNKYQPFANRTSEPIRGFRTEEAYLNRAEAYAALDRLQEALDDVNHLRRYKFDSEYDVDPDYYKYTLSQYPTQEQVMEAVRTDRRRELCFEFHRWYDLRRYGMPEINHSYGSDTFTLHSQDPKYVLQIPQRELDYNPLMRANPR